MNRKTNWRWKFVWGKGGSVEKIMNLTLDTHEEADMSKASARKLKSFY